MDESPKWKRYGNCIAVKKFRQNVAARMILTGKSETSYTGDPAPGECSVGDFMSSTTTQKVQITLSGLDLSLLPYHQWGMHTSTLLSHSDWAGSSLRKSCQRQAFEEFIPSLETGLNLTVALAEFGQTRGMLVAAFNGVREIIKRGYIQNLFRAWGNKPLKSLASHHLANEFGVKQLLSDIRATLEKAISARKDIKRLFDEAGKRRTLHWSTNLPSSALEEYFCDGRLSPQQVTRVLTSTSLSSPLHFAEDLVSSVLVESDLTPTIKRLKYSATCDHRYHLGYMGPFPTLMAAFDQFGIRLSAADIWEVVPFSFVIDWFLDVGQLLERFRFDNVPITVEILDFCDSLDFWYEVAAVAKDVKPYPPAGEWGVDPPWEWRLDTADSAALSEMIRERCYYRLRDLPDLSELREGVTWRLPTTGWHLATSAALFRNCWR